ncbi:hypothetical protein B0O99DRAFT_609008 [Bisporella sp. PMI_857]|nr:hypothetical protein B0O99DRAFT_609008 [Bisporella sp. PMI_857]
MEPDSALLLKLDLIHRKASVATGTSKDEASTPDSIPKIAMLPKTKQHFLLSRGIIDENSVHLLVRELSAGQPHRAVPIASPWQLRLLQILRVQSYMVVSQLSVRTQIASL